MIISVLKIEKLIDQLTCLVFFFLLQFLIVDGILMNDLDSY